VAGNGRQLTVPPPPAPEPTHWLEVAAATGFAPGVSALMLFVMVTRQVIGCAASLSEPLHWLTLVTRLVELVVNVPFPGGQGPSEHCRVSVVFELVVPPLIVLTTVTVHVIAVVAPVGPGPMLLHCPIVRVAAKASDVGRTNPATMSAPASNTRPVLAM
jgi:hypothetical protein